MDFLDHFIQICLFSWPVIVTWICEPEISERYFFLGHPVLYSNVKVAFPVDSVSAKKLKHFNGGTGRQ